MFDCELPLPAVLCRDKERECLRRGEVHPLLGLPRGKSSRGVKDLSRLFSQGNIPVAARKIKPRLQPKAHASKIHIRGGSRCTMYQSACESGGHGSPGGNRESARWWSAAKPLERVPKNSTSRGGEAEDLLPGWFLARPAGAMSRGGRFSGMPPASGRAPERGFLALFWCVSLGLPPRRAAAFPPPPETLSPPMPRPGSDRP